MRNFYIILMESAMNYTHVEINANLNHLRSTLLPGESLTWDEKKEIGSRLVYVCKASLKDTVRFDQELSTRFDIANTIVLPY